MLICPNCNFENLAGSRFCANCAKDLVKVCPVCDEENLLAANFCRQCKADLSQGSNLLSGLRLDRAKLWAEQFETMGWFDKPSSKEQAGKGSVEEQIHSLINNNKLSVPEDPYEPWIFACYAKGESLKGRPYSAVYLTPPGGKQTLLAGKMGFGMLNRLPYLIATRCRLAIVATYAPNLTVVIPYTSMSSYTWWDNGAVELQTDIGKIWFRVHLLEAGFLNVAVALAGSDPVSRYRGVDEIRNRASQNKSLMEVIGMFLKEAYESTHRS